MMSLSRARHEILGFVTKSSQKSTQFWPRHSILVLTHTNKIIQACSRDIRATGNEIPTTKNDFFLANHTPAGQSFLEIQIGSERLFLDKIPKILGF